MMSAARSTDRARIQWRAVSRIASVVLLALAIAVLPAAGQGPVRRSLVSADSARLVADLFFRAVADERWDVAAAMTDTMVIRRMVLERLRWRTQNATPREMTIEDFMRDDPDKPRVVAEYELRKFRERSAKVDADPISYEFAGVKSLEELSLLSARAATARFLEAQDQRASIREMARRAGCPDSVVTAPFTIHRILGAVLSTDTIAYVLHTDEMQMDYPTPFMGPMVMELRLRRDGWRIRPDYGVLRRMNSSVANVSCDSTARRRSPG